MPDPQGPETGGSAVPSAPPGRADGSVDSPPPRPDDGADGGTEPDEPGDGGTPPGPPATGLVCNGIVPGLSTLTLNGTLRGFDVQLPNNTANMAVLFLWHGYLQAPGQFAGGIVYDVPRGMWVPFDPNAFPVPLLIVTPWDLKILPPWGLDWDIVGGATDLAFFEAMLECIGRQYSIDSSRIYSMGFSAGAVFSNLLTALRPHLFAATISESGAWFNDEAEWSDVLVPIVQWQWPGFVPADGGNILLTHGGPTDFATVISLESAARKALTFLFNSGRTVTECAHTFGHSLDPDLTQSMYYDYLWAHQLGGPPLDALPPGFPSPEHPVGATSCFFHPATL